MRVLMQPFNFKIVRKGDESAHVPASVAEQVISDVQTLLTDIGRVMITKELRLQGKVPDGYLARFNLFKDVSDDDSEAVTQGDDTLMLDALDKLFDELDHAIMPETFETPSDHTEAIGRRNISRDILNLHDHLEGYEMLYGTGGNLRKFRVNRRERLGSDASFDGTEFPGALIGVISRDPTRKNHWNISNGRLSAPITFNANISQQDIPIFSRSGPVIASGMVRLDDDGYPSGISDVTGVYSFPAVKFHRIITGERDIVLLNPAEATPAYNATTGTWSLECEDLGISVDKPSWDDCVTAFQDYFVFLWETYRESDDEFEGEELDIRNLLLSMEYIR